MARFRKIDPRIWNDAKFSSLSNEGKLLFLYLLTSPAMTVLGALPMRATAVAEELQFEQKRYAIRYKELSDLGIVEYDERGLFWVKNFLKYNSPDNPKVVISWRGALDLLPECPLLSRVLDSAKTYCNQRGSAFVDAFSNSIGNSTAYSMPNGITNSMSYKEKETEKEKDIYEHPTEHESKQPTQPPKKSSAVHRFALTAIPASWLDYAKSARPDLDPEREFQDFRFYFTEGNGASKLRSEKGWNQAWQGWVRRAKEQQPKDDDRDYWKIKPEHDWRAEQDAYIKAKREQEEKEGLQHEEAIRRYFNGGNA